MLRMEATCNLGDYSDENYNDEENRLSYKRPETNKHVLRRTELWVDDQIVYKTHLRL